MMMLTVGESVAPTTGATAIESATTNVTAVATAARRPHETPRRARSLDLLCIALPFASLRGHPTTSSIIVP
jgi:hypothetical protein